MDYDIFLLTYFLLFINTALSAFKWKILLKADKVDVSFGFLLQSYLVGSFANIFLPSNIGGDVIRVYDLVKSGKDASKSVASVFIDRASGFFALSAIGLLSSIVGYEMNMDKKITFGLLFIFGCILTAFLSLFYDRAHRLAARVLSMLKIPKVSNFFEKFISSINAYKNQKKLLLKILSISFVFQLLVVVIIYLYSRGWDFHVGFLWFLIFIPIISIIESIPLTPYALGIRDMSYVFFFTTVGLKIEEAEFLAITYVAMTLLYSAIGGFVFLFRKIKLREAIS